MLSEVCTFWKIAICSFVTIYHLLKMLLGISVEAEETLKILSLPSVGD